MTSNCVLATPDCDSDSIALHSVHSNRSFRSSWSQWSSHLSISFKTRFPWLLTKQDDDQFREAKECEIIACLAGNDKEQVDLWRLRELALQRGGLISSSLRKRAWPKLVGAHEQVLRHAASVHRASLSSIQVVEVSYNDTYILKKEVAQCIWDMEDHFRQQKEIFSMTDEQRKKQVSFAVSTTEAVQMNVIALDLRDMEDKEEVDSRFAKNPMSRNSGTWSSQSHGTLESFTLSTRTTRWSRPSLQEQRVLFNIICSVLRTSPEEDSPYFEDDRYHYYSGLQDMTAVMLINLESPSLTSLVLGQLATNHLRDAMRQSHTSGYKSVLQQAAGIVLMPLLQHLDNDLHDHLVTSPPSTVVTAWVSTWFCHNVAHLDVASRLADVFLVSHGLMPLYVSAALIAHFRSQILQIDPSSHSIMYSTLQGLPLKLGSQNGMSLEAMAMVEDLITTAVSYMERISPKRLLHEALKYHRRRGKPISALTMASIALFQETPTWITSSVAPTDWELLKQAKAMRNSEGEKDPKRVYARRSAKCEKKYYPLAFAAAGVTNSNSFAVSNMLKLVALLTLLACGTVAIVTGIQPHYSMATGASKSLLQLRFDSMMFYRMLVLSEGTHHLLPYLQDRFRKNRIELPPFTLSTSKTDPASMVALLKVHVNAVTNKSVVDQADVVASESKPIADCQEDILALESQAASRTFSPPILRQSLKKLKYAWGHVQSWWRSAKRMLKK